MKDAPQLAGRPNARGARYFRGAKGDYLVAALVWLLTIAAAAAVEYRATVVDSQTGQPLPARVYMRDAAGNWLFVQSADAEGSALPYREQWVPLPGSEDQHTTISAHPFRIDLPPGTYEVRIERGKEYHPLVRQVTLGNQPRADVLPLHRWANLAERGWYSGETHVHRRLEELPNVMLAEDLNVAFPVTFWTTFAGQAPGLEPSPLRRQGPSPFGPRTDRGPEPIVVDATHVMFPRNTEYEIFSFGQRRHTLGAVFILNHRSHFTGGMPPVGRIAELAHAEGALLDLDKHSWPWSMMLVPVAKVDLYELSNNSVWRTRFGFRRVAVEPARYMQVETDEGGLTEWGWLNYGFENYYSLLNCGLRLRPTAGTASGVHPVPLGYGRVYVQVGPRFEAQRWIDGLRAGRSFVTTGPMLLARLNDQHPGHVFRQSEPATMNCRLQIESLSSRPIDRVEVVVNGRVQQTLRPAAEYASPPADYEVPPVKVYREAFRVQVPLERSGWVVVRSFERQADGRIRFAHTAPWHVELAGQPVRPRAEEVEYLTSRVRDELERSRELLPAEAIEEFRAALRFYENLRPAGESNE
ncbi:MAG: carboxypeptidase regulatory-like domain-containing protein [Pirellulaceae bacterium]|nr:carboxypeptidase regulatory-like domain-containing protein [Pirellulaceae bacterium]